MTNSASERTRVDARDAEAAEKAHGDKRVSEKVPADEETEGAMNALETPAAPPEMVKDRRGAKS